METYLPSDGPETIMLQVQRKQMKICIATYLHREGPRSKLDVHYGRRLNISTYLPREGAETVH